MSEGTVSQVLAGEARWSLAHGECCAAMSRLPSDSIDVAITDAPYHLTQVSRNGSPRQLNPESPHGRHKLGADRGFMGKTWDGGDVAFRPETWESVLRVLKPGAHLFAFGGTRTYHRMACAIEDAGFEIRDSIHWLYGSGFPKSLNLGEEFEGWGTALKPGHEPILVARKPLVGTVLANMEAHGVGALNIDAGRIATDWNEADRTESWKRSGHAADASAEKIAAPPGDGIECHPGGRWPANVVLTHSAACGEDCAADCPVRELEAQSGVRTSGTGAVVRATAGQRNSFSMGTESRPPGTRVTAIGDTGTAARFFHTFRYEPKAATAEREAGCEQLEKHGAAALTGSKEGQARLNSPRTGAGRTSSGRANTHPTVKPIEVMRWLCRLGTPPGGVVLDVFAGSGSTGCAAVMEGFRFIGIEMMAEYVEIARARIAYWIPKQLELFGT